MKRYDVALAALLAVVASCARPEPEPKHAGQSEASRTESTGDSSATSPTPSRKAPPPPEPLQTFLRSHEGMRLPTIADTPWKEEFLKGDFHPFVQADTNRDGVQDLVVVVAVAETFSVVVFHGGPKAVTEPLTIMRHSPGPISGVIVENDGTIKPITCYACESEDIFRWNGRTYARGIFLTNETACIASNASVFPVPDKQLPAAYRAKEAGNAIVLEPPAWAGEQLWYKVRLPDAQDVTGFLEAKDLAIWDGPCKP